jgi:hypothetical protein
MSEPTNDSTPVQPKTLKPYRHKIRKSASKIQRAMSGVENLSQADQVAAFQFVINELRKMTGGAVKALELAQSRDYAAYKSLKDKVKQGVPLDQAGAGALDEAQLTEFQKLMASLGQLDGVGEYQFGDNEVDEAGQKAAEFQANQASQEAGQESSEEQPDF